jgi:hypothetical protein
MRTNNIAALEYNIDENWGFYVDIENLNPVSLNNNINVQPNHDDYYNKRYGSESYNSEIFYMDEDIEPNKNIDNHKKNNINTVNDMIMNVSSATIITAALSCIILFIL